MDSIELAPATFLAVFSQVNVSGQCGPARAVDDSLGAIEGGRGWQWWHGVADRGRAGWQGAFLQPAFSPPPFIASSQNKRPSQMKNSHPVDGRLCRCVHSR